MSLILEALRKSEAERRRAQAPDLRTELPPTPVRRRVAVPPWAWVVPGALLLAVAWWLHAPAPSGAVTPTTDGADPVHQEASSALPAVPRLSPPTVAVVPTPAEAERPSELVRPAPAVAPPPIVAAASAPSPVPVEPTPLPSVATAPPGAGDGQVLQLSDLSPAERKSLPPLKVSMHLWDSDPARRFVIVDGNRLVEGDRIGDAVVTTISADGVLLDWNGRRLKLPIR